MKIVIREFTSADEEDVQLVSKEALATLRKFYAPSATAKKIGSESSSIRLVAIYEDRIIGTVIYEEDSTSLYFGGLGVLEDYRRKGVLRILVERLEQIAKRGNFQKLTCATMIETGNVPIFEKLGFQVVSSEITNKFVSPAGQPVTEVRLEKLIR
jgi:GNAT superfamily N-acetyltransferase